MESNKKMGKDNVQGIIANLNLLSGENKKSKFSINGETVDYSGLQDALSGKKLKGDVKIDLDGDGIFDVKIKSKELKRDLKSEVKTIKYNTQDGINLAEQLVKIDGMLDKGGLSDTSKQNLELRKKEILKEFKKMGANPEDFKKRVAEQDTPKEEIKQKEKTVLEEKPQEVVKKEDETPKYSKYTVLKGESPLSIAKKLGVPKEKQAEFIKELLEHNKKEVKTFKGNQTGKPVKGFWIGAKIEIPEGYGVKEATEKTEAEKTKAEKAGGQKPIKENKTESKKGNEKTQIKSKEEKPKQTKNQEETNEPWQDWIKNRIKIKE